ncbi:hypothetical protein C427_3496 [Paraglaciecola psychrophila 170]|uniref:Uncharacterized protein n=1 Tax=Paraglaciecola psychrophila 170 TaxID=1129794 RepID=K7A119_9ALTE|nr:hypothetical protein C427_3496 [Paraglaciecola psychrophila 170]GAC36107.1 hypothetical protein GPSY_0466 [Paraglaciecola psychrophila 170]
MCLMTTQQAIYYPDNIYALAYFELSHLFYPFHTNLAG